MIKRIILYIIIILFSLPTIGKAKEIFGIGFYLGGQHDVGTLSSYNSDIQLDPQNNYIVGFSCKVNIICIFLRTGMDTSFLISDGGVKETSDDIESTDIQFTTIPFFAGLNFRIHDKGEFYMGAGCAYMLGRGKIETQASSSNEDIDTFIWATGFIAGVGLNISSSASFYIEWEYLNGKSDSIIQTQSTNDWNNYYIDFTGHRILLGFMYYLI